jgi:hypothetical protein
MAVTWDSGALETKVRQACVRVVAKTGGVILEEGSRLIASPPKTGRIYERDNPRRIHQASAPGEAPATDLGKLLASGEVILEPQTPDRISARVNWGAEYALDLELGTKKIEPRPFARPALAHAEPGFVAEAKAEIEGAVRA